MIYKTNIAASHAAGRWQQLHDPELLEKRPYQKLMKLDAPIGAEMAAALRPALLAEQAQAFAAFVDTTLANKVRGKMMIVGALKPDWVSAAEQVGVRPATAEIAVRDKDVWHTFRDAKTAQVNLAWYKNLPRHLGTPGAVVLDPTHLGAPTVFVDLRRGKRRRQVGGSHQFPDQEGGDDEYRGDGTDGRSVWRARHGRPWLRTH